jgi:hypothetical protein
MLLRHFVATAGLRRQLGSSRRSSRHCSGGSGPSGSSRRLLVGAAQFRTSTCIAENVGRIVGLIEQAGSDGIDLLAFAETATTGYVRGHGCLSALGAALIALGVVRRTLR